MKKPSEHIIHSLNRIKGNQRFKNNLMKVEAEKQLKEVFGSLADLHITNVRVSGETLHIHVNSSTLKHELHHDKIKLLEQLHKRIGQVVFSDVQIHG